LLPRDPGASNASESAQRTPPGSFALCESEATATNVLSARKRSVSDKCFICAKAKRQRQMFYLRESEASATNVLSARKRSVSDKAPSRNGNQPHVMVMSLIFPLFYSSSKGIFFHRKLLFSWYSPLNTTDCCRKINFFVENLKTMIE